MANTIHYDEIRRILTARRNELLNQIQSNLRDARAEASEQNRYRVESGETSEVHPEDELAFALLQLRGQVLNRIDEAMRQLDEGTYGYCGECGDPIAAPRLRALPFAVRCKDCEEMREQPEPSERRPSRDEWRRC
jgi:DnaK suppressor protein